MRFRARKEAIAWINAPAHAIVSTMAGFWRDQSKGLLIGLSGGFFGGLAGLGGGIIMIPLMSLTIRLTQHQAHGTSLMAIVFTSFIGSLTYFHHGSVDWAAAFILASSAIITSRIGVLYAHSLPENKLRKAFGIFVICISVILISKDIAFTPSYHAGTVCRYAVLITTGIFTGFLIGMMGVGGGSIMIPSLVMLIGMPQHVAQGTSLLAMVPGSAMGAYTHYKLGNIVKKIALGLMIGAAAGGHLGAAFAHAIPEFYLRLIFAMFGLWMGIKYLRS